MSEPFSRAASRLAGFATRTFGWTPDQFWAATPAEMAAILSGDDATAAPPLSRSELDTLLERDAHD